MNGLLTAAYDFQSFGDTREWKSCIVGGIAVQRWGEPRVTRDVDMFIFTSIGGEEDYITCLLGHYQTRIKDPESFARKNRVLLLQTRDKVSIDVSVGALPFEDLVVQRATTFEFTPGLSLRTCSAEDLIVMKLFASRVLDIHDAETVAIRHRETLDWPYIERQLGPLAELKGGEPILQTLDRLRRGIYHSRVAGAPLDRTQPTAPPSA